MCFARHGRAGLMTNVCRPRKVSHTLEGIGTACACSTAGRVSRCTSSTSRSTPSSCSHPFPTSRTAGTRQPYASPPLYPSSDFSLHLHLHLRPVRVFVARFSALCVSRLPAARRLSRALLLHCTAT